MTATTQPARLRGLCIVLSACLLPVAGVQAAYYNTSTQSSSASSSANGTHPQTSHAGASPGGSEAASEVISSSGNLVIEGGAYSSAQANLGGVHLLTEANARLTNPDYNFNRSVGAGADASASFSDMLRLSAPGVAAGTAAFLTYRITVSGDLGVDGVSSWEGGWSTTARWSFTSSLGSTSTHRSLQTDWVSGSRRLIGDGAFGDLDITVPVTFGSLVPFTLGGTASVGVSLGTTPYEPSSAQFRAFADLGHTIGWGGILSLRTADGTLIEDYSAIGDSGFDYRLAYASAVPEPTSALLIASGLAVLGLGLRQRGRNEKRADTLV